MKASVKRIIWGIGWYLCWTANDYVIYISGRNVEEPVYQLTMFLTWIVPLLLFQNDKEKRE